MKKSTLQDYRERILKVLVHIQENLDNELDLEDLGRIAYFSPYHFHRIFTGMVGETVKEHIRRLRLERSAQEVKYGTKPLVQIAFSAGYQRHESFSRAFKALFGQSPSDFRSKNLFSSKAPSLSGIHYQGNDDRSPLNLNFPGETKMKVTIKNMPAMRVAFIRHTGPYAECGSAWEKLCMWAGPQGLLGAGTQMMGLSYDDPNVTPPEKIRYDACITVDSSVEAQGEVGIQEIQGGEHAVTTHFGPYEKFIETYGELCGRWIPQNGREASHNPSYEIYMNSPEDTDPEDLITDIHVPLKPKEGC